MANKPLYYSGAARADVLRVAPPEVLPLLEGRRCCRCQADIMLVAVTLADIEVLAHTFARPLRLVCPACLEQVMATAPDAVELRLLNRPLERAMARHAAASN